MTDKQMQRRQQIQIKILQTLGGIQNHQMTDKYELIATHYHDIYQSWLPGWALFILVGIKLWKN